MLSRLVNLHGVMRGMFPLQVIRYLRGSGVVERLNREGEVGRGGGGGCRVETRPQRHTEMLIIYNTICNILALFCNALPLHGMENNKQNLPKNDRRSMSMNNIDRKIKKCIPMQHAHSFQNIFRKKLLLPFKFVSDCTALI